MRTSGEPTLGPCLRAAVADVSSRHGAEIYLHAVDLETGREHGLDADSLVVAASVFKIPVLVEALLSIQRGALAATRPIHVPAGWKPTAGPTGLSCFSDDTTLSVRDLLLSMMSVSDNRATDIVMDLVGRESINTSMRKLGYAKTELVADCAELFEQLARDTGLTMDDPALQDPAPELVECMSRTQPLDPPRTNRTTARETTDLLRRLWTDDGVPAEVGAEARRILRLQVWPHRLASGFADQNVEVGAKTGTLWFWRNEAGVVQYRDGRRYAVAVFLRMPETRKSQPHADAAIGLLARAAVDDLRAS